MLVLGIGNVTQCNKAYIFLDNEGKQDRIKTNKERLDAIYVKATENIVFYDRMANELTEIYEKKKAEAEKKYHYISDEEIQEASKQDRRKGFELSLKKDSVNEEYFAYGEKDATGDIYYTLYLKEYKKIKTKKAM